MVGDTCMSINDIVDRVRILKETNYERDQRHYRVNAVRSGNVDLVAPGLFSDKWPKPIIANYINSAARDLAEAIAPMPAISCRANDATSQAARNRADKRTWIANFYPEASGLERALFSFADHYITFGQGIFRVEANLKDERPHIHVDSPMGSYPELDRFGKVTAYAKRWREPKSRLVAQFPELANQLAQGKQTDTVELIKWWDAEKEVLLLGDGHNRKLIELANPLSRVPVAVAQMPGFDDQVRGQFDDVLWSWLARAKLASLKLEAAQDAVEAPIALPFDVDNLAIGGRGVIRAQDPSKIRRVSLDVPPTIFAEDQGLQKEIETGSRHSPVRLGAVGGSTVTGKGVEALLGGFDTQIKTAQAFIGQALQDTISMCFEMDEKVWGPVAKEAKGTESGQPYTVKYTPEKDIDGDYTVDVGYGLMAGLDPNRALVWGLQARSDGLISRDTLRRNLPLSLNIGEEEKLVEIEKYRDALSGAVQSYAQALPALAQQGSDPREVILPLAKAIDIHKRGAPVEDAVMKAFEPEPPPPQEAVDEAMAAGEEALEGGPGGGSTPGLDPATGRLRGLVPGQSKPGGMPDVKMMLAGLTPGGKANLQANISRRQAI